MEEKNKLPEDYLPFNKIIFCSNVFRGKYLIEVDKFAPLLIGKGVLPLVWLSIPLSKDKWEYIIERNISHHPKIIVDLSKEIRSVVIKIDANMIVENKIVYKTVLSVIKISEDSILINKIDLRPMGLDIYGDENSLNVGTTVIKDSTFESAGTMIGIGENNQS